MDLALATGRDVARMSEREFTRWRIYAHHKSLPLRRIEFMLAQIARLIDQTMGGATNVSNADYLFDPERDESGRMIDQQKQEADVDVEAIARDWM